MSPRSLFVSLTLCALLLLPITVTAGRAELEAEVDAFLGPIVDMDLISGSVLIARNGEILLAKGYGPANREYEIPCTPETKFRLGSVSKQFTSAAIMLLVQQGKVNLEDTVGLYFAGYPNGDKITVHHLLTHRSGIPNYNNLDGYGEKMVLPLGIDSVIAWFRDEPLQFEPGTAWAYSNSGYVLLAGIIERVSGESYADFLHDNIFEPLGMHNSGQDVFTAVIPNRATGHGNDGEQIYQAPYRDMPFTSGAGSLYSTVLDLFKWDRALYGDEFLSAETRQTMFTPVEHNYACGWFVDPRFERRAISHTGAINGFLASIERYVDDGVLVVALLNYESTFSRGATRGLAAIALGEEYEPLLTTEPVAVDQTALEAYCGQYEVMPEVPMTVTREGDVLVLIGDDARPMPAVAQSVNQFFVRAMNAMVRFNAGEDGTISDMILLQGAHGFRCKRVE